MQSLFSSYFFLLFSILLTSTTSSCQERAEAATSNKEAAPKTVAATSPINFNFLEGLDEKPKFGDQIGEYITTVFEDSKGAMWFGTMSKGIVKYDEKSLIYYKVGNGKCANGITNILEDNDGNLLVGSHAGLYRFDGMSFIPMLEHKGEKEGGIMDVTLTKDGTLWVSNWKGVYRYDGKAFQEFELPKPAVENPTFQLELGVVHTIFEDQAGNLWFGRDGYGVCKYDGENFTHFTKADGLTSNTVSSIFEDSKGRLWMGASHTRVPKSAGSYQYIDSKEG